MRSCRCTSRTAFSCRVTARPASARRPFEMAYEDVFKAITLHVKFDVVEVVVMNPEWAFARTNSAGTQTDHATGQQSSEGNQELFIFQKKPSGAWKIARYSFSPTNPP